MKHTNLLASAAMMMAPLTHAITHELSDSNLYHNSPIYLPTAAQANRPPFPSGKFHKKNLRRQFKLGLRRTPARFA